ncbi:MAG: hypothetical protein AAAFM81_06715 [Pseudomonadota bacterium]
MFNATTIRWSPITVAIVLGITACSSGGDSDADNAQGSLPSPALSFTASAATVNEGDSVTLTWDSANADSCEASDDWTGSKSLDGNETIQGLAADSQFTLTCRNSTGSVSETRSITVNSSVRPAPTLSFTAAPSVIDANGTSQLLWTAENADSCVASGAWGGTKPVSGAEGTTALAADARFELSCSQNQGPSVSRAVTVSVRPPSQGQSVLSGAVDSSYVGVETSGFVYVFSGDVAPDDRDGGSDDPVFVTPVIQTENSCSFSYQVPQLSSGRYTIAVTDGQTTDRPDQNDQLTFRGRQVVDVQQSGSVADFIAERVLTVGPGRDYSNVAAAVSAANAGDVIEIDAGVYEDDVVVIRDNDLVLRGVGGRAHIRGNREIGFQSGNDRQNGKGLWVLRGSRIRVENIEFSGADVVDDNGAGIRNEARDLTICNGFFHDNENGILGGAYGTLTIEYSEFDNNGYGEIGRTHNVYIDDGTSSTDKLVFRHNYSHRSNVGHLLKTRAYQNIVTFNNLSDEDGTGSYNIDVSNGGLTFVIGNIIQQGPGSGNGAIIAYGPEGLSGGRDHNLYVAHNTFVNDRSGGSFLQVNGSTSLLWSLNNIFAGGGTVYSGRSPDSEAGNVVAGDPGFADRSGRNYRLNPGSVAIDAGSTLGSADGQSLDPQYQYLEDARRELRIITAQPDAGAYESQP